jgi:hypothetical protein
MLRSDKHKTIAIIVIACVILGIFIRTLLGTYSLTYAGNSVFQSIPPKPENPHAIDASSGGRIYCGLPQSSVWLNIPSGFTSEWGGSLYCDVATSLPGNPYTWNQKGYLLGYWVPLRKPLSLVFEIDPTRVSELNENSFVGRYYAPGSGWLSLPTDVDTVNFRVYLTIPTSGLPQSGYEGGYEDRYLVALFRRAAAATSTPTEMPTQMPTQTPLPTSTLSPSPPPTHTPTPVSTSTSTPIPTAESATEEASEIFPTATAPVESDQAETSDDSNNRLIGILISLVFLVAIITVILMSRKQE